MKITDEKQLAELKQEYAERHVAINKPLYNSRYSESSRIIKMIRVIKLAKPVNEVFKTLLSMLAKDMNANLTYEDLEHDAFYRAGTKNKKHSMHLAYFKENEEVTLEWFTYEAWISKNFKFYQKPNSNKTKITYLELVKGNKAKTSPYEQVLRNNYIKAEIIRFDMQMYELKKNLGLLTHKETKFYDLKMSKYKERLSKIRIFTK
ncbi:hypothetical protein [Spiroplasma eriocheiris]|uniref:Uncharacterized protein n=1 Tax=Spiroplasma eriocheiris TaxID=315358 RepID=A0A0H3XLP9_9MOLU|nr:hypothetical protein [Spiroplasma eriocheiris]AHF57236.1 hypothetical protein SPE_0100 [Spiroplasma eriocheiris CCTCC M 207170]AKM53702.1 hypothetical protein SERIO_v1c01000 [Spiroplasma eriocheiris]